MPPKKRVPRQEISAADGPEKAHPRAGPPRKRSSRQEEAVGFAKAAPAPGKAKAAPRRDPRCSRPKAGAARGSRWSRRWCARSSERFREAEPEPKGELEHVNPFTLLVAVVLSAQATDAGVNRATRALFAVADTPQKMLDLGEDEVREAIKTIGLFRNKAKNVIALSQQLVEEHGGEVPRDREVLETLPGVGRKTANVVLNMAFGQPTMAVDTHLFRVSNRIRPRARQDAAGRRSWAAAKVIPPEYRCTRITG